MHTGVPCWGVPSQISQWNNRSAPYLAHSLSRLSQLLAFRNRQWHGIMVCLNYTKTWKLFQLGKKGGNLRWVHYEGGLHPSIVFAWPCSLISTMLIDYPRHSSVSLAYIYRCRQLNSAVVSQNLHTKFEPFPEYMKMYISICFPVLSVSYMTSRVHVCCVMPCKGRTSLVHVQVVICSPLL